MKIIIEGCDGSGKSTLATKLAKIFNCDIEHDSKPCNFDEYKARLLDGKNTIYDRFFVGQFVYNKIADRKLTPIQLDKLKLLCNKMGVIMIYLNTDTDIVVSRLMSRDAEEQNKDKETMEMIGVDNLREFVNTINRRYLPYIEHFTIISKGDLKDE